jgi:tetratricopeptide (TPR) repeat protein
MLENGGDDLKVDYVRRELCFAGVTLGIQLGLHDEMNSWMANMARVEGMADTFNEFNIYRLHDLGEHEAAVRLGHEWLESLGGASDGCNVATFTVLKSLVWAGEYQAAINLIEQIGGGDGECEEMTQFWLAGALRGMGQEEEAFPIIERLILADIPGLENRIFTGGWRPPQDIAELASSYALAGRTDEALDTLEMAVDEHYRVLIREDDLFVAWKALYENPRFQELEQIIADDLDRQAERVKVMLAERDLDELFAKMQSGPQ